MKYNYIPNTFNSLLIRSKFANYETFLLAQINYRKNFEKYILSKTNISDIIKKIENIDIPKVYDKDYNFYHKYSYLNSEYLYIRNNYHVENLTTTQINMLLNDKNIDEIFILKTYKKVLFEYGDITYIDTPRDESKVYSNSLFIEFVYNLKDCSDSQSEEINSMLNEISNMLNKEISDKLKLKVSFVRTNNENKKLKNKDLEIK